MGHSASHVTKLEMKKNITNVKWISKCERSEMAAITSFVNSKKQKKFMIFQRVTTSTMVNSDTGDTTLNFTIAALYLLVSFTYYPDIQPYITLCRVARNVTINTELESSKSW
jgi:hypothetical protein